MQIKIRCCDKKMEKVYSYFNGQETISFTCLRCGRFKTIIFGTLDEEELEAIKENVQ